MVLKAKIMRCDMENVSIERQYQDSQEIYSFLLNSKEISYATYVNEVYKKVLVLSAASYFEKQIVTLILSYANAVTNIDKRIVTLIEKKALERQYHTLFSWDANNTNSFWSLFGTDTKQKVREIITSNEVLKEAEKNFLEIGRSRNLLVHNNFAIFNLNITLEEIYSQYKSACKFLDFVESILNPDFVKKQSS